MAYNGSTAASSIANPPVLGSGGTLTRASSVGPNPRGGQVWYYSSTDATTAASAANFFTDAWYLGMRPGDIIHGSYYSSFGSTDRYAYRLIVTSVTTNGAACSTGQMSTA